MSKTFESFMKQYHATGREKLDGYDPSHFEGLTAQEISTVEEMLINDAMKLDTAAIQGLGYLGTENSKIALRNLLSKTSAPCDAHLCIVKALWKITRDIELQKNIIEDFDKNNAALRQQAAIALQYTTPSPIMLNTFLEMLRTEQEAVMRTLAAGGILLYHGLLNSYADMENFKKYLQLVRMLSQSNDENTLISALSEVEKEAAKFK